MLHKDVLDFIHGTVGWMKGRKIIVEKEEAILAGTMAVLEAIRDGEIVDNKISERAKRYVRREIQRATGRTLASQNLKDYGYERGNVFRRGPQKPPTSRTSELRHERMAKGVCPLCGGEPAPGIVNCQRCREKRKEYNRKRLDKAKKIGYSTFAALREAHHDYDDSINIHRIK